MVKTRLLFLYQYLVYRQPVVVLLLLTLLALASAWQARNFELDASGESLVLENDPDLNYYREVRENYGTDEYLVVTYTPRDELLSFESLAGLQALRDAFLQMDSIDKVNSILDAPVIYQSGMRLSELGQGLQSLRDENIDRALARREFATNPFYRELLVSADGRTTALQLIFRFDEKQYALLEQRRQLLSIEQGLNAEQTKQLEALRLQIKQHNSAMLASRTADIQQVREIMDTQRHRAQMYLGGIPMITSDMIRFIRHDLVTFGIGVLVFLLCILAWFFRQLRWVMLPLLCCLLTAIGMLGFLGSAGWRITVISSNFISILLIITLSLCVHIIVRFRDLQLEKQQASHMEITREAIASIARPCFYTILTTIVAFASLVVSGIRPVIDFGWIMIIGLSFAFVVCFTLIPASLSLVPAANMPPSRDFTRSFTLWLAGMVRRAPLLIIVGSIVIALALGAGMSRLKVENRFIDNFKPSTEIYQGMTVIDQQLGGTTPLEIIIDADSAFTSQDDEVATEDDEFDAFFLDDDSEDVDPSYWLNPTQMDIIHRLQAFLEEQPVVGKVLSIGTVVRIAEHLNQEPLDAFELALIHRRIPNEISDDLIKPYLSGDTNQVRFSARAIESDHSLNRQELLAAINDFIDNELGLEAGQARITGMLVLYNNMLQSLFRSQILTLGAVLLAVFLTFFVLFRQFNLALLGIIPNIFSAVLILGIMGWLRIPLDMMTITIASITIGIAVDDTIHYIHRLKHEFPHHDDYAALISRCHGSIGKAMYYTSVAIVFGFGLLVMSNFIPTINFGLMTGVAMLVALAGNLLLLPAMVLVFRPVIVAEDDND